MKVAKVTRRLFEAAVYALLFLTVSCRPAKNLLSTEEILVANEVVTAKTIGSENLALQIKQQEQSNILGMPLKLYAYRMGQIGYDTNRVKRRLIKNNAKWDKQKLKGFSSYGDSINKLNKFEKNERYLTKRLKEGNWFMRTFGEKPVIYDSVATQTTVKRMKNYLFNRGYFNAQVVAKVSHKKRKRVKVTYSVSEGIPRKIRKVRYHADDSVMDSLLKVDSANRLIKPYQSFDGAKQNSELDRLEKLFRNNGYYGFSRAFIFIVNDTANFLQKSIDVEIRIALPSDGVHKRYKIASVTHKLFLYDTDVLFTKDKNYYRYRNVDYFSVNRRYSPRTLDANTEIYPGDFYSQDKVIKAQSRLGSLDIFKFINISLDTTGGKPAELIVSTTRLDRFQISEELGMVVSQGAPGPFANLGLRYRNPFWGFELFEINARYSNEGQISSFSNGVVFRTEELGINSSLTFPRIVPTGPKGYILNDYRPRTRLMASYTYVNRPEYQRIISRTALMYNFQPSQKSLVGINPIDITINRTRKLADVFKQQLDTLFSQGNNLITSFNNSLVTGLTGFYQFTSNPGGNRKASFYFRVNGEVGGAFGSLYSRYLQGNNDSVASLQVFRYVRVNTDFRYTKPISRKFTLASRLNLGFTDPLGRSNMRNVLPYEKYFFSGGSNSIRAWAPRRLGPGGTAPPFVAGSDQTFDYRFEQPGNLLIEANIEARRKVTNVIELALFIDAGNVWTLKPESRRPEAHFDYGTFLSQVAVGTGIGLRLDFDFMVLRADVGVKAIDPARDGNQKWRLNQFKASQLFGETNQTVINFGIGYPF